MDDYLEKELNKNKKYHELIYKQLDRDKKAFVKEIKSDLGYKIFVGFSEPKKKLSFWGKLKKVFK